MTDDMGMRIAKALEEQTVLFSQMLTVQSRQVERLVALREEEYQLTKRMHEYNISVMADDADARAFNRENRERSRKMWADDDAWRTERDARNAVKAAKEDKDGNRP